MLAPTGYNATVIKEPHINVDPVADRLQKAYVERMTQSSTLRLQIQRLNFHFVHSLPEAFLIPFNLSVDKALIPKFPGGNKV